MFKKDSSTDPTIKSDKSKRSLESSGSSLGKKRRVTIDELPFGPVNNLASSLFSAVDVELNGAKVESCDDSYPYKAYLSDLLKEGTV